MYRTYFLLVPVFLLGFQIQYTYPACSPDYNGNPKYGSGCEYTCHCKNATEQCDAVSGQCTSDCANGWMGPGCQKRCTSGTFGNRCSQKCSNNCKGRNPDCNHIDGTCTLGCKPGWQEQQCRQACTDGTYGKDCKKICDQCLNGSCDKIRGKCTGGCRAGYKDTRTCVKACDDGHYGHKCAFKCSGHCKDGDVCQKDNGQCQRGCAPGWQGETCNDECTAGTYGINCDIVCNAKCRNPNACNNTDGRCDCKAGWRGYTCDKKCSAGTYGRNCTGICSAKCKSRTHACNKRNGKCDCKAGWRGSTCDKECDPGMYGDNCEEKCSVNCLNTASCRNTDGHCEGCKEGWRGNQCEQACKDGRYGRECAFNCSGHCKDGAVCQKDNGQCQNGCAIGWKGESCKDAYDDGRYGRECAFICSGTCKNGDVCQKDNGQCQNGCAPGWLGETCKGKSPEPESRTIIAVGGIMAAILLIVITMLIVLFVRRRRRNMRKEELTVNIFELNETNSAPDNDNDTTERIQTNPNDRRDILTNYRAFRSLKLKRGVKKQSKTGSRTSKPPIEVKKSKIDITPIQMTLPKHAVRLTDLKEYIISSSLQKDHYANEFNKLPYGVVHPTAVASKPTNRPKNRYTDMLAYDHSRVVLQTLPGQQDSDYINASFINGHNLKKAYIATQAPTIYSIDEFWRMIWEKEVTNIVMITNLIENGKVKCLRYWKNEEPSSYGSISLTVDSEEVFADFTIRKFIVKSIPQSKQRIVTQYQFTSWLDKSTPKGLTSLVQFWCKVRKDDKESSHPWLVHCSAGVGRTGTFIALDILYDQGKELNYVNVYQCVQELRRQRVNMVQTQEQYKYLHKVAYEAVVLHTPAVPSQDYEHEYINLLQVEKKTGITGLMSAFEMQSDSVCLSNEVLSNIQEHDSGTKDVFSSAKLPDNRNKNRYNNILAANDYRPFLSYYVPGCNDYINAVYLPSSRDLHGYLLTQAPMEHTAVDCCRLINEKHIKVIVTFDDSGTEKVGQYLPEQGSLTVGPFELELTKEENKADYTIRHFNMEFKGQEQKCITQIAFRKWSRDDPVPQDIEAMINLLQEVEEKQRQSEGNPVLVQCLNGAERSGLVVVLMNVLNIIRIDQEVAILQVIRYMRQIRQQILPNYEQYKFCHEVVLRHIQNTSSYANL